MNNTLMILHDIVGIEVKIESILHINIVAILRKTIDHEIIVIHPIISDGIDER